MPIGIVPIFTEGEPFGPTGRMCTDETPQIALDLLIYSFGLPIRLGVSSRTHAQLRALGVLGQLFPKDTSENTVSI